MAAIENPLLTVGHRQRGVDLEKDGETQHLRKSDPPIGARHCKGSPDPLPLQRFQRRRLHRLFRRVVQRPPVGLVTELLVRLGVENEIVPEFVDRPRRHGQESGSGHMKPEPLMQTPEANPKVSRVPKFALEFAPDPVRQSIRGDELLASSYAHPSPEHVPSLCTGWLAQSQAGESPNVVMTSLDVSADSAAAF
jgi:hypothetical protein